MRGIFIIVTIAIFLPVTTLGECSDIDDRPCCREAKYMESPDADPQPGSRGDCVFDYTLCSYIQGCADSSMSNWTPSHGYAYAHPKLAEFFDDQTVLVSPLLDLRQRCRFAISYGLIANGDMDVFLEDSLGEHIQLILRKRQRSYPLCVFNETVSIASFHEKRYGRVKIRATGGGHQKSQVQLYSVSLHEGDCKGCTFEDGFCDWVAISWNTTSGIEDDGSVVPDADNREHGSIARLVRSFGTLSSPTIRATPTLTGCVRFRYMVWGTESRLNVSLVNPGGSTEMWRAISSDEPRVWRTGVFPVQSSKEYRMREQDTWCKIRFTGQQDVLSTTSVVALDSVLVNPDTADTQCGFEPPEASPGGSQSFTTVPTTSPTSVKPSSTHTSSTSKLTSAQAGSSTHAGAKTTEDDSTTSSPVIIGASVAGGIVLITVILLLVFLVRRNRQIQRKSNKQNDGRESAILSKQESRSYSSMVNLGGDYTEIGDLHLPPSRAATNDYTEIDASYIASQRNSTRPKPDDSPYKLAKAFPDKSHLLATPTNAGLAPSTDQTEADYNHIPGSRTTPQTTQNASKDDYHTLNFECGELSEDESKHGGPPKLYDHMQSGLDDVYNKMQIGKRTVVIDSDYDHVKH